MWTDWLLPALLVVALDQASKSLLLARSKTRQSHRRGWTPRIRPLRNRRLGLGIVRGRRALALLWAVVVIATVLLMQRFPPLQGTLSHIGLGAALGGATANLVDVLWRGAIIDFIDLRVWPVFNLADAAIVVGLGMAAWSLW